MESIVQERALLDPARPELLEGHDVLVENGLVKEVSDRPLSARVIDLKGKTLMPGLIDLHVHVIAVQLNLPQQMAMPNVLVTFRSAPILRDMLRRGYTTCATPAAPAMPSRWRWSRGWCRGRACSCRAGR